MQATPATELQLVELFSSLQGEGLLLGRRQVFVRLAGCNLDCAYCDTAFASAPTWRAEVEPGCGRFAEHPNPVALQRVTGVLRQWQEDWPIHHSLALTGGEPLLQCTALAEWLPQVSRLLPVFLETNGTLPERLPALLPWLTWVSMDVKLASATGTPTPWTEHAAFLRASAGKLCQVKVVIDDATPAAELVEAAGLVRRCAPEQPLIIQPRTVAGRPVIAGERLLALQALAAREHRATLVIPQLHPLLSIP